MNLQSILLSIGSAIFVSFEIVVYKHIINKYQDANPDMIMWIYRLGSVFFISLFLIWELFRKDKKYKESAFGTLHMNKTIGWLILISLLSALSIVMFFRAVNVTSNAGLPTAIRSFYIPLTFLLATWLITKDWKEIAPWTYIGEFLIVVAIGFIIYGSTKSGQSYID